MQENDKDQQLEVPAGEATSAEEIQAQPVSVEEHPTEEQVVPSEQEGAELPESVETLSADELLTPAGEATSAEEIQARPVSVEEHPTEEQVVPSEQEGAELPESVETLSADELLAPDAVSEKPKWPAEDAELMAMLEAVIYITDEPLTMEQIAAALEQPRERIKRLLDELVTEWQKPYHGLSIREVAGGYKMATKPEHHEAVRQFVKNLKAPMKLSLPALETLAVIAYKQPVTAPEVMDIRGVQGAGVLKTLIERKLIAPAGRKNVVGKPILYKTTREFLVQFGLKDLAELPSVKEFEELSRLATPEPQPASEAPAVEPEPSKEPAAESPSEASASEEPQQSEPLGETVAE